MVRTGVLAASSALLLGACVQILGDDFEVTSATGAAGSMASAGGESDGGAGVGASGAAGGGDATGGTGGTGGTTGTAGMGGSGGTVGPGCDPYAFGLCGPNRKCSVVNFSTGDTDCIATSSRPVWSRCDGDDECVEGTFCSPLYGTCKPLCKNDNECPAGENSETPICNVAWLEIGGAEIPGIELCVSHCNAVTSAPCATPGATCNYTTVDSGTAGYDCVGSGNISEGGPCDGETADDLRPDCIAGHGCFGNPQTQMGECYRWCTPIGSQGNCNAGAVCGSANAGTIYGICPQ